MMQVGFSRPKGLTETSSSTAAGFISGLFPTSPETLLCLNLSGPKTLPRTLPGRTPALSHAAQKPARFGTPKMYDTFGACPGSATV